MFTLAVVLLQAKALHLSAPKASPAYSVAIGMKVSEELGDGLLTGTGTVTLTSRKTGHIVQVLRRPSITIFKDSLTKSIGKGDKSQDRYGKTHSVVFQDFDFDGVQDLAICKDLSGSYGAPTYAIYRWQPKTQQFVYDANLTKLSSEHLGLIETIPNKRQIVIYDKDGAAWHQVSIYKWLHGKPVITMQEIEDAWGDDVVVTTRTKVGSKWKVKVRHVPKQP